MLFFPPEKWISWEWDTFQKRMNPFVVAFFMCFVWWLLRCWRVNERYWKYFEKIPGPAGLPLIGNTIELNVDHGELFQRLIGMRFLWGNHEGVNKAWLGPTPYVFVSKANTVESILGSNRHTDKSSDYRFLQPWLGTGLLTGSGNKWHKRRKILTPTFHFNILEDFIEVFGEQTEILVDKLSFEIGSHFFNIFPYVTLCTLDIICETAMGRQVFAQNDSDSEYVRAVYEIGSIIQTRQASLWYHSDILFRLSSFYKKHQECIRVLHNFSYKVISERRTEIERERVNITDDEKLTGHLNGKKKRLAFLDLLIEASNGGSFLTNEDIREEVDTFMFEGHDTTSSAVCWTLYLLGCHPEYQEMVVNEVEQIFHEGDRYRRPTLRDLKSMKYLDRCIKEALRLYPSVPLLARRIAEEVQIAITEFSFCHTGTPVRRPPGFITENKFKNLIEIFGRGKYVVPEGTTAMIIVPMLHRDPQVFPNPDRFDPDRFTSENSAGRHPYAYIPFSAGPRNCIGQKFALLEEKVIISGILRRYNIEAAERREDICITAELVIRAKNGLSLKLTPRKTKL